MFVTHLRNTSKRFADSLLLISVNIFLKSSPVSTPVSPSRHITGRHRCGGTESTRRTAWRSRGPVGRQHTRVALVTCRIIACRRDAGESASWLQACRDRVYSQYGMEYGHTIAAWAPLHNRLDDTSIWPRCIVRVRSNWPIRQYHCIVHTNNIPVSVIASWTSNRGTWVLCLQTLQNSITCLTTCTSYT